MDTLIDLTTALAAVLFFFAVGGFICVAIVGAWEWVRDNCE